MGSYMQFLGSWNELGSLNAIIRIIIQFFVHADEEEEGNNSWSARGCVSSFLFWVPIAHWPLPKAMGHQQRVKSTQISIREAHIYYALLCVNTDIVIRRNNFFGLFRLVGHNVMRPTQQTHVWQRQRTERETKKWKKWKKKAKRGNAYNNMRRKRNTMFFICDLSAEMNGEWTKSSIGCVYYNECKSQRSSHGPSPSLIRDQIKPLLHTCHSMICPVNFVSIRLN